MIARSNNINGVTVPPLIIYQNVVTVPPLIINQNALTVPPLIINQIILCIIDFKIDWLCLMSCSEDPLSTVAALLRGLIRFYLSWSREIKRGLLGLEHLCSVGDLGISRDWGIFRMYSYLLAKPSKIKTRELINIWVRSHSQLTIEERKTSERII